MTANRLFILCTSTAFLFSCTVQKRLHMSGHHVSWNGSKTESQGSKVSERQEAWVGESIDVTEKASVPAIETSKESAQSTANEAQTTQENTAWNKSLPQDSVQKTTTEANKAKELLPVESAKPAIQKSPGHQSNRSISSSATNHSMDWMVIFLLIMGVIGLILLVPGILLIVLVTGTFSLVAGIILLLLGAFIFGLIIYALWIAATV